MGWFFLICAVLVAFAYLSRNPYNEPENLTDEERQLHRNKVRVRQKRAKDQADWLSYGASHPKVICPHCQTKGKVRMKSKSQKKGISGGKAVGAVVTGGASILVTGISRHEKGTQARCTNCNTTWMV